MSGKLQQIQAKARELALSGTFKGWRSIAFTLQFEEGFAEAFDWTYSHSCRNFGRIDFLNNAQQLASGIEYPNAVSQPTVCGAWKRQL